MSAELDKLFASISDKSDNTKRSYKTQYKKLANILEARDMPESIHLNSQSKLIEIAREQDKSNSQQAIINIAVLVRRLYNLNVDELIKYRESNKSKIHEEVKVKNSQIIDTLPSLSDIEDYTQHLYDTHKWTDYIINWLLINIQVRNLDLNFKIILRKKDAVDKTKNYIWLTAKKCVYIRNNYKTAGTYKQKINTIFDIEFRHAVKRVVQCQKYGEECGVFLPNEDQIGYYIKKATYQGIGEGAYLKIIIDANRGNLQKLKEISDNRGTSIKTLIENYDLQNQ